MRCLLVLLLFTAGLPAAVVHVDAGAADGGDGTTWASAFNDLAIGLAAAESGDQVWVAQGRYQPSITRIAAFEIRADIALYGGFRGFETALGQRADDPGLTVLTRESASTSYQLVAMQRGARLDTCTITGLDTAGWAVRCQGADAVLHRVRMRANHLQAAVFADGAVVLDGCEFLANTMNANVVKDLVMINVGRLATNGSTITRCVFAGTRVVGSGTAPALRPTAIHSFFPTTGILNSRIDNCLFVDNPDLRAVWVENSYAAIEFQEANRVALVGCTFVGNALDYRPPAEEYDFGAYRPPWFYGRAYACILAPTQAHKPTLGANNWDMAELGDPGFVEAGDPAGPDGVWGTDDDGLRLRPGAAASGAADATAGAADGVDAALASDLRGLSRPQGGASEPGAYEIDAGDGDRAPAALSLRIATREDVPVAVPLAGIDADGDVLLARIIDLPANGALFPTHDGIVASGPALAAGDPVPGGVVLYVPAADNFGAGCGSFTFLVGDGICDSSPALAVVDVTPVNDAPTIAAIDDLSLAQDQLAATIALTGISAGGGEVQRLTLTAVSGDDALVTVVMQYLSPRATAQLVVAPVAGAAGSTTVAVTVVDDGGTADGGVDTIRRTFAVRVVAADLLVIPAQWFGSVSGVERTGQLTAVHREAGLAWSLVAPPAHVVVTLLDAGSGLLRIVPPATFAGSDTLVVQAADGAGNAVQASIPIVITGFEQTRAQPVADAPHQLEAGAAVDLLLAWQAPAGEDASLRFVLAGAVPAGFTCADAGGSRVRITGTLPAGGGYARFGVLAEAPTIRTTGWWPLALRLIDSPAGRN